jgi:5-methylcytosine-specific restriction enzyme A
VILRACIVCGVPSADSYCEAYKPRPWQTSPRRERRQVSGWEEQRRRQRVLAKFRGACHWCGHKGATEVEHVVPLAEGGPDSEANLAPIHAECHRDNKAAEARRARA